MNYLLMFIVLVMTGCTKKETVNKEVGASERSDQSSSRVPAGVIPDTAIFAGGCFWCMEGPFEKIEGVYDAVSGYTGGHKQDPTYHEVGAGTTGHLESIMVLYDMKKVSYDKLLDIFWHQIDATDDGGQYVDRGEQYSTGIFYVNDLQKSAAEKSKAAIEKSGVFGKPIVTPIIKATRYYPAEDYHQDFYLKNPDHYNSYRRGSGRDAFIEKTWGKTAH